MELNPTPPPSPSPPQPASVEGKSLAGDPELNAGRLADENAAAGGEPRGAAAEGEVAVGEAERFVSRTLTLPGASRRANSVTAPGLHINSPSPLSQRDGRAVATPPPICRRGFRIRRHRLVRQNRRRRQHRIADVCSRLFRYVYRQSRVEREQPEMRLLLDAVEDMLNEARRRASAEGMRPPEEE